MFSTGAEITIAAAAAVVCVFLSEVVCAAAYADSSDSDTFAWLGSRRGSQSTTPQS